MDRSRSVSRATRAGAGPHARQCAQQHGLHSNAKPVHKSRWQHQVHLRAVLPRDGHCPAPRRYRLQRSRAPPATSAARGRSRWAGLVLSHWGQVSRRCGSGGAWVACGSSGGLHAAACRLARLRGPPLPSVSAPPLLEHVVRLFGWLVVCPRWAPNTLAASPATRSWRTIWRRAAAAAAAAARRRSRRMRGRWRTAATRVRLLLAAVLAATPPLHRCCSAAQGRACGVAAPARLPALRPPPPHRCSPWPAPPAAPQTCPSHRRSCRGASASGAAAATTTRMRMCSWKSSRSGR